MEVQLAEQEDVFKRSKKFINDEQDFIFGNMRERVSTVQMQAVTLEDSLWDPFKQPTEELEYLRLIESERLPAEEVYSIRYSSSWHHIRLDNREQLVVRTRLDFWEVIAKIGGYHDGLVLLGGLLLFPLSASYFHRDFLKDARADPKQPPAHK